jgi:hypothetical protein
LSLSRDRPAIAFDERNEATTRTAIQQHALILIGEEGYYATTEQVVEVSERRPAIAQSGGLPRSDPRAVAPVREGPRVGRADRDDLMTMELSGVTGPV